MPNKMSRAPHVSSPKVTIPTFESSSFSASGLLAAKGTTTIAVALPAKDEASTIGTIVSAIRSELMLDVPLIDELVVIDDHSSDDTAAIARRAGARVIPAERVLPEFGPGSGKGEALWKSLHSTTSDLICWCDADIRNYDNRFVLGPLGPLLTNPAVGFAKGFYQRPLRDDGEGGGRVTELMARPLIATLFPHLGGLIQPLSGEFAGRRELLEQIPFCQGYAVDLALLIDLTAKFGVETLAQVDLGSRIHRNRPLRELALQSAEILAMALNRSGTKSIPDTLTLSRPNAGDATVQVGERPPLRSLSDQQILLRSAAT